MAELTKAQANHLRLLLGWIRCEIGPTPREYLQTIATIAGPLVAGGYTPDEGAEKRLREGFEASKRVPKYVRDAVKALEKIRHVDVPDADEVATGIAFKEQKFIGVDNGN